MRIIQLASLAASVALVSSFVTGCAPESAPDADTARAAEPLIYGSDDRREAYELDGPVANHLAEATAALFDRSQLDPIAGGYALDLSRSFASAYSLCADEPFRNQPSSAFCTGFLVAPDLMVTAGHCIDASACASTRFVFGYHMLDAGTVTGAVPDADVFTCAEVLGRAETNTDDWAVVRLDRASDRAPLAVRRAGQISTGAPVIVAGHPAGLPFKFAAGATVRDNSHANYFGANVDTYGGNSGSPVVAADGTVEGILVRGNTDFVYDRKARCYRSNVCADSGCPGFEDITRTSRFVDLVPADGGGDPPPLCDAASCDDGDACTVDVCDPAAGCSNTPVLCGAGDSCVDGACVPDALCTDLSCDDGDPCTVDICDPASGCSSTAVVCGDGESCVDGVCEADDVPACLPRRAACGSNAECCSGRCHRRRGCR